MKKSRFKIKKLPALAMLIVLIMAVLISTIAVAGTLAAFQTTVVGVSETPVADWGFDVKINTLDAGSDSLINGVDFVGVGSGTSYTEYNIDADSLYGVGQFAPGTKGYMPIEIDGTEAKVSMVVTVTAYFGNLPENVVFTDNLGRSLEINKRLVDFEPTGTTTATSFSSISYKYYLSHKEIAEWAAAYEGATDDSQFIDIGFRWNWVDDGNAEEAVNPYNEIRVTGRQVVNASSIPANATAINFASDVSGLVLDNANTLNILTSDLGTATITPKADFYLDVNEESGTGKYSIVLNDSDATASVNKLVLGTLRRDCDYKAEADRTPIEVKSSTKTMAYISRDFKFDFGDVVVPNINSADLVDYMNNILDTASVAPNTLYAALNYIIDNKSGTEFETNYTTATDVASLTALIVATGNDTNDIVWDAITKSFAYIKEGALFVTDTTKNVNAANKHTLFKIYPETNLSQIPQTYAIYLAGTMAAGTIINTTVGVDVGANTDAIAEINYARATATTAQSVVIRTNSETTTEVTVNAPLDTVNHYGDAKSINIIAAANKSYHEFGTIHFVSVTTGRVVFESTAEVTIVHLNKNSTTDKFESIIIAFDEKLDEYPVFSRDSVDDIGAGKLVCEIQTVKTLSTDSQYVWLTQLGILEQIKVSTDADGAKYEFADSSNVESNIAGVAEDIANNFLGDVRPIWVANDTTRSLEKAKNIAEIKEDLGLEESATVENIISATVEDIGVNEDKAAQQAEDKISGEVVATRKNSTVEQYYTFKSFRDAVNDGTSFEGWTLTLLNNVDLKSEEWTPIGSAFRGTFDGANYTISGLNVKGDDVGLFSVLNSCTVKNLNITGAVVSGGNNNSAGGLTGKMSGNATVDNVTTSVDITFVTYGRVGGISGTTKGSNNVITNCTFNGTITTQPNTGSTYSTMGGIVGQPQDGLYIDNCTNNGTLTALHTAQMGGIIGALKNPSSNTALNIVVTNCKNTADFTVYENSNCGGLAGKLFTGSGQNIYFQNGGTLFISNFENEGTFTLASGTAYIGGVIGAGSIPTVADMNLGDLGEGYFKVLPEQKFTGNGNYAIVVACVKENDVWTYYASLDDISTGTQYYLLDNLVVPTGDPITK